MKNAKLKVAVPVLLLGLVLSIAGILIFLAGPVGNPRQVNINGRLVPLYDFTQPFLGISIALIGLGLFVMTIPLGNPLLRFYNKFEYAIRTRVAGMYLTKTEYPGRLFFGGFAFLVGGTILAVLVLWQGLQARSPSILQPLVVDSSIRFGLYSLWLCLMFLLSYFLASTCLGAIISGLVSRLTQKFSTRDTREVDELMEHLMNRELVSKSAFVGYAFVLLLAWLAFVVDYLRLPFLISALLLWAFVLGKSCFVAFTRTCRMLGFRPEHTFKPFRIQTLFGFGIQIWKAIVVFVTFRMLLQLTLNPVSQVLGSDIAYDTLSPSPLRNLFYGLTDVISNAITQVVFTYLVLIMFLIAATNLLFAFVFPEYFFRKSNRTFIKKVLLAIIIFCASAASQVVMSYLTPSSPNILVGMLLFVVLLVIAESLQKSYEQTMKL
jgi:hypothetical protein